MPRIFDNIDEDLLAALRKTLQVSKRADQTFVSGTSIFEAGNPSMI